MSFHTDCGVRPRCGGLTAAFAFAVLCAATGFANATDTGAVGNGDWSVAATWSNGVPGASDNAYIGGGYPTGTATSATVTLSQNSSANNVSLGFNSGTGGTLDLNGFTLTASNLFLGGYGSVGSVLRTGGGTLAIGSTLFPGGNSSFTFAPSDIAYNLSMSGSSSVTTTGTSNLTGSVLVGQGCTLTMGADLTLPISSGTVDVHGTLNANGFAISAPNVYLGYNPNQLSSYPATLVNRGPITAGNVYLSYSPGLINFDVRAVDAITNLYTYGVNATFASTATVPNFYIYNLAGTASTATTTTVGNLTDSVTVGGTLNLGANLSLTGTLDVGGTLNANGHTVSAGTINLGTSGPFVLTNRGPISAKVLTVSSRSSPTLTTFNLTSADTVESFIAEGISTILPPGVSVLSLSVSTNGASSPTYATASTTAAANITRYAEVGPGCTLTLGADLPLPLGGSLDISGTLNANGRSVSAGYFYVGEYGGPVAFQNDGLVTAMISWNQTGGSHVRLNRPGDVLGDLLLSSNSTITIGDASGQLTGTTVSGLSIDATSDLNLEVNGLAGGWVFRWANPSGGDHIADLQNLINGGEITFSYLNGGSYALTADSGYTYVSVTGVPEPSALLLSAAAAGLLAWKRCKRK